MRDQRLLVISDLNESETDYRNLMHRAVGELGWHLAEARSNQAPGLVSRSATAGEPFALAIVLATGAHGRRAAQIVNELRAADPQMRFLVCGGASIDWTWVTANIDAEADWMPLESPMSTALVAATLTSVARAGAPRSTHGAAVCEPDRSGLIADVSTALRTPLDSLMRYAELLSHATELNRTQLETIVSTVVRSGEQLSEMIDDLLDLAQLESGAVEITRRPCSLPVILDHVAACARADLAANAETLVVTLDESIPEMIEADAIRLGSVLTSLIMNAIEHAQGERIDVRVGWYDDDRISIAVQGTTSGDHAIDSLAISRRMATVMGARLDVSSCGSAKLVLETSDRMHAGICESEREAMPAQETRMVA